eukprot:m.270706 g.270706  ORF g.270706 m.270706 type:complete len:128 (+) comp11083_c2_seq5:509-892(+)
MNNEQDTFLSQNVSDFPLNQYRFLWFLFAADALYPIFAAIERSMLGSYPPKRFYQTKLMTSVIWVHIVCGSTILITGMWARLMQTPGPTGTTTWLAFAASRTASLASLCCPPCTARKPSRSRCILYS